MEHSPHPLREWLKIPGWFLLAALCFAGFTLFLEKESVGPNHEYHLKDWKEPIVAGVAFFLFVLGDTLDSLLWKTWLNPRYVKDAKDRCCVAFGIAEDSYRVSKSLAIAANEWDKPRIWLTNELAKFFRSLVLPGLGIAVWLLLRKGDWSPGSLWVMAGAVLFFLLYWWLKASHVYALYSFIENVGVGIGRPIETRILRTSILFFWNGQLVSSAKPRRLPAL